MNCVVIGYGSIGQRHARILTQLGCRVAVVSRREISFSPAYRSLTDALTREKPDYVVIASETGRHYADFTELAALGFDGTVLVEKPLFHAPLKIPENRFQNAYVAYNLRFHPILRRLAELVKEEPPLCAQVYVGQYLPDWRPGRDYRENCSARRSGGGGVLYDLSHEPDYLLRLFGGWKRVAALGGRLGALNIESDDAYSLLFTAERCPAVQVHLNYLDRIGRREITLITENRSVKADLVLQTLQVNQEITPYTLNRDDTYILQHKAVLNGEHEILCTLHEGLSVLEFIRAAEQAAEQEIWVMR
jgi:Predicted dehydrogenases and related proteins